MILKFLKLFYNYKLKGGKIYGWFLSEVWRFVDDILGSEIKLKEGEDFCTKCGHKIIEGENPTVTENSNKKSILNISNRNFKIVGYILAIISIIITVLMAMGLPLLVLDSAILLIISGVLGGLGVIFCIWKDEHLIASICAFAGLIMCFISAFLGSIIPCILFLITALFCLLGGELKIKNKKYY